MSTADRVIEKVQVQADITVVGGGLAGVCAAIAAARSGKKVALVQNRPVLGGNSSSEIRVWVVGATAHGVQHFARETGIMGEFFLENQFTNKYGNPYYWDLVLANAVRKEENIELYLNTEIQTVDADGPASDRTIRSVGGWQMGSERWFEFSSPAYIDCSGDGIVGYLAGAEFMSGRESRAEYGEEWAPEVPDNNMLGSTILFYSRDVGHPVKFVAPDWAEDISKTAIPERRVIRTDMRGCAFWWIEWGGELDIVKDNEDIRDRLQAIVYGIWDYIKNSGKFDADTLDLEWIGSVPGKREYRRFIGGHVLTQQDIVEQREFPDTAAFGGWSIDLHPVDGVFSDERGALHLHPDGNYHLPLRMLYSKNVTNMWMAGRNVSATHVAFGGTRVMATCATLGEAAGIGAAVSLEENLKPSDLALNNFDLVKHRLIYADSSLIGVENDDPRDLIRRGSARASSELAELSVLNPTGSWQLESQLGMIIPVTKSLSTFAVLVDAEADTEITARIHDVSQRQNYLPNDELSSRTVSIAAGKSQWVEFDFGHDVNDEQNVFLILEKNEAIRIRTSDHAIPGVIFFEHRTADPDMENSLYFREWKHCLKRESICFKASPTTDAFRASKVIGGYARPYAGPQIWCSSPMVEDETPWVEVQWDEPVDLDEVVIIFDDEVDEDLINLHHHTTEFEVMPGLVKDYQLLVEDEQGERVVADVEDNRQRTRRHWLPGTSGVKRLRLRVTSTNGAREARVVALRAYAKEDVPAVKRN